MRDNGCTWLSKWISANGSKMFWQNKKEGPEVVKSDLKGVDNVPMRKELTKQIIWKFVTRKIVLISVDHIWDADHADMQIISKYDKRNKIRFPLCFLYPQNIRLDCSIKR